MLKGNEHYQRLIQRYLANDCSPEEAEQLFEYLRHHTDDRTLLHEMQVSFEETKKESLPGLAPGRSKAMQQELLKKINSPAIVVPFYKKRFLRVAAAILFLCAGSIAYLQYNQRQITSAPGAVSQVNSNKIPIITAGTDKALLTLADGTVIVLDEAGNGKVASEGSTSISKTNSQVIYDASVNSAAANGIIAFNTISTPRGGQYQIVLPDGSKVWLNASSSLRFPTAFTGDTRKVELTGEGYFEIAKNAAMPFYVAVNNMNVEVLGTHFNIMAYDNEAEIKTTLLEGSVKVNAGATTKILKPGQQSKMDNSTQLMKVQEADTEQAVAWKNGYFQFEKEDLKTIMRQFARWYDVDVAYEGNARSRYFSGEVARTVDLGQALKVLQQSDIKFRIENKKITVLY